MMSFVPAECSPKLGLAGCVFMCVCTYMRSWVCRMSDCVCVFVRVLEGWWCLKVMLTVHTQTAPEESASLVDPLCMGCVCARTRCDLVLDRLECLLREWIMPLCASVCMCMYMHEFFTLKS